MLDGSTIGRAFEYPLSLFVFGGLVLIAAGLWIRGQVEIRRAYREDDED